VQKVVIIHGYTGHPRNNWFPWLASQLAAQNVEVIIPQMPHPDKPKLEEWLAHLDALQLGNPSELYMVGHSLGCSTILQYAARLPARQKLAGAVLVAGFAESIGIVDIDNFLTIAWDDAKIRSSIDKLVAFNSNNDPYVPISAGEHLHKRFGGEFIKVDGAGHFNRRDGYQEFPALYDKIKGLLK
jgi:predicted alpha/beta hydrolase family esterase